MPCSSLVGRHHAMWLKKSCKKLRMDLRLLLGMLLIIYGSQTAAEDEEEGSKLYMEACAKQELFANVPPLNFTCSNKIAGGYYADVDTGCHIFHLCAPSNLPSLTDHPFCCHPELVFDQRFLVCDRPENVDCPSSSRYYSDQFDGPVKVQERENEETQARSRERQSRGNQESSTVEEMEEEDHLSALLPPAGQAADSNAQQVDTPGKAVTLPPAFRQSQTVL